MFIMLLDKVCISYTLRAFFSASLFLCLSLSLSHSLDSSSLSRSLTTAYRTSALLPIAHYNPLIQHTLDRARQS